jgi:hypothetical protein
MKKPVVPVTPLRSLTPLELRQLLGAGINRIVVTDGKIN